MRLICRIEFFTEKERILYIHTDCDRGCTCVLICVYCVLTCVPRTYICVLNTLICAYKLYLDMCPCMNYTDICELICVYRVLICVYRVLTYVY